MRGHIRKRGNSWVIVVELPRDPETGKRQKHWQSFKGNKKEAERELNAVIARLNQGIYLQPTKMTVGEYLESWIHDYVTINTSPRTQYRYRAISLTGPTTICSIGRCGGLSEDFDRA